MNKPPVFQRRALLGWGLLSALDPARASQGSDATAAQRTELYIAELMDTQHLPGMALAVMRQGRTLYAGCWGHLRPGSADAVDEGTRYCVGSLSKPFLAQAVLMLKHEGRLRFDDPIQRHLGPVPPHWRAITVRQLLNHTSGLRSAGATEPDDMVADARTQQLIRAHGGAAVSNAEILTLMQSFPLRARPGSSFMYSNAGYTVLASLVSRLTGRPYTDFVRERIFMPLGMQNARFMSAEQDFSDMAAPCKIAPDGVTVEDISEELSPAFKSFYASGNGGVELSLSDLMRWDAGLGGRTLDGDRLPSSFSAHLASLPELWAHPVHMNLGSGEDGQPLRYGLGWLVGHAAKGQRKVWHGGYIPGYRSQYVRYLDAPTGQAKAQQLSVLVLSNQTVVDPASIAMNVAGFFQVQLT